MNGHWTNRLRTKTKQGERRKKTRNEKLAKKEHKPEERKIITGKEILNKKRKSAKIRENKFYFKIKHFLIFNCSK